MNIYEDATKRYGEKKVKKMISISGHHANRYLEIEKNTGHTDSERLIFALLEIIDFGCCDYNSFCNPLIPEDEIKNLLIKHKNEVVNARIDLPSYTGVLTGVYDFIMDD
jgi:hypothetical protein